MTAAEFAQTHGVSRRSLYWWSSELKRRGENGGEDARFVAVEVVGTQDRSAVVDGSVCWMELVTRSGRIIRIGDQVDADILRLVLQVAEQC
jgi:hypothetical protein